MSWFAESLLRSGFQAWTWFLLMVTAGSFSVVTAYAQEPGTNDPTSTPTGRVVTGDSTADARSNNSDAQGEDGTLALSVERVVSKAAGPIGEGRLSDAAAAFAELAVEDAISTIMSQEDAAAVVRLAAARFDLGSRAEKAGDFALAADQYAAVVRLREVTLHPADPSHAVAFAKLGGAKRMLGDFKGANESLQSALAKAKIAFPAKTHPQGHQLIALVLNDLGALQRSRGDYSAAAVHYVEALEMFRRLLPADSPSIANAENNLAFALQWDGQFAESRRHFETAIKIYDRESNRSRPGLSANAALIRHSLGGLMQTQGEYGLAEIHYLDALQRLTKEYPAADFPDGHPRLATVCSSLGMLYFDVGEAEKSIAYHRRALQYRKAFAAQLADSPDVAMSIRNLANALGVAGAADEALPLHEEALEMRRRIYAISNGFEPGHPHLAESLRDTALAAEEAGKQERAESLMLEAVAMYRGLYPANTYPNGHFDLADCLDELGRIYDHPGNFESAVQSLEEANLMRCELAEDFLLFAAEAEARNFIQAHLQSPGRLLDLWQRLGVPPGEQYELLWRGRRILPRILAARQSVRTYHGQATETGEQVDQYLALRHRLASLSLASADARPETRLREIRELTDEKETIERDLSSKIASWDFDSSIDGADDTQSGPERLAKHLPQDAAWIDLIEYAAPDKRSRGERRFVAFVACDGTWSRIDLGDQVTITDLCESYHDSIREFADAPRTASELTERVWKPIDSVLSVDVTHLFLCPDGALAQLAWPALRDSQGNYLVERYNFELVPNGPFLLKALLAPHVDRQADGIENRALLVGGVDFGIWSGEAGHHQEATAISQLTRSAGDRWGDLPSAEQEVAEITTLLQNDTRDWNVEVLTDGEASVDNVLMQLETARIAHFATHGLFAFDEENAVGEIVTADAKLLRRSMERNPLLASGLVLARANEDPEHGLLLAETIAARPMQRLDLVVLSACDSGRGRLLSGEGVYGLQQAFHLAGAKQVVASRWKVDDDATRALMTEFYRNLLSNRYSISESLRQSQLKMIESYDASARMLRGTIRPSPSVKGDLRKEVQNASPFFWAAFCVSGGATNQDAGDVFD